MMGHLGDWWYVQLPFLIYCCSSLTVGHGYRLFLLSLFVLCCFAFMGGAIPVFVSAPRSASVGSETTESTTTGADSTFVGYAYVYETAARTAAPATGNAPTTQ